MTESEKIQQVFDLLKGGYSGGCGCPPFECGFVYDNEPIPRVEVKGVYWVGTTKYRDGVKVHDGPCYRAQWVSVEKLSDWEDRKRKIVELMS